MHSFRNMYALFLVLGFAVASPIAENGALDLGKPVTNVKLNSVPGSIGVGCGPDNDCTKGGQLKGDLGQKLGFGMVGHLAPDSMDVGCGPDNDCTKGGQLKGGLGQNLLFADPTDNKDSEKLTAHLNGNNVDHEPSHTLVSSKKHKSEGSNANKKDPLARISEDKLNIIPAANEEVYSDPRKAKGLGNVDANNKGLAVDDDEEEHLRHL